LKPIGTGSISHVVRRHIQIAGFNPPQYGAHMIRHSFATHLIRQGASLKEIGDILGHRKLESTHIYTKTAVDNLREVALEVPEIKKK
jgi:integrase/recombinase XerD